MAANEPPRNSNILLWLVSMVAVGGAAFLGLPRLTDTAPQPTKPPTEGARDNGKTTPPPADLTMTAPLVVLRDHLRVEADEAAKSARFHLQYREQTPGSAVAVSMERKEVTAGTTLPLSNYFLRIGECKFEFLIATVPDPIESRFGHEFDAVVAAIQRAYAARGFVLRASRMPWVGGQEEQSAEVRAARRHRWAPASLLFHKVKERKGDRVEPPTLAVVCLVGETPISGIHKAAMTTALRAWEELNKEIADAERTRQTAALAASVIGSRSWAPLLAADALVNGGRANPPGNTTEPMTRWDKSSATVRMVAPMFSGSQTSLAYTLREWQREGIKPPITIINGSATALQPVLFEAAGLDVPKSTVIPNELVSRGVLSYLAGARGASPEERPQPHGRVAILREANTGFGVSTDRNPSLPEGVIDLPFPLSISQLQTQEDRPVKLLLPHTEFVEPKLPLRNFNHLDSIPPYDPAAAATTSGQSLREILATIERVRVRYVGIMATDSRDVVFLNRLLRKQCPNVRVFTTEPSVALLHPEDAYHLQGMVVGSTYPLAPVTQYWSRSKYRPRPQELRDPQESQESRQVVPFPTQASLGYYNAILAHFDTTKMLGYRPPSLHRDSRPEDNDTVLERPPIWISVVGQGGRLVPVHCYTEYDPDGICRVCETDPIKNPRKPRIGIPLGVMLGSLSAFLLMTGVILVLLYPWFWRHLAGGLAEEDAELDQLGDNVWIWLWRGVMLAGVLLFVVPYTLPARELLPGECCEPPDGSRMWRHVVVVVASVVLLVQIAAVVTLLLVRIATAFRTAIVLAAFILSAAAVAGLVWGVWVGLFFFLVLCVGGGLILLVEIRQQHQWGCGTLLVLLLAAPAIGLFWGGWVSLAVLFALVLEGATAVIPAWEEPWTRHVGVGESWRGRLPYAMLAFFIVAVTSFAWIVWGGESAATRFFLYVRATDLPSGLSPIVPMMLLGAAAFSLGWFSLRQADQARRSGHKKCAPPPASSGRLRSRSVPKVEGYSWLWSPYPDSWVGVCSADAALVQQTRSPRWSQTRLRELWIALAAGLPFFLWISLITHLPTGEGIVWDVVMRTLFGVVAIAVLLILARFLCIWSHLEGLLGDILRVPMVGAFERLPHEISRLFGGYLYSSRPRHRQLAVLAWMLPLAARLDLANRIAASQSHLAWVFGKAGGDIPKESDLEDRKALQWLTTELRRTAYLYIQELPGSWGGQTINEAFGGEGQSAPSRGSFAAKEDYVAAYVVVYLGTYFAQLRMLVYAMMCSAILLLLAAASYPFQPARPQLNVLAGLLGVVAVGTVYVLYRINKNGLVSRISRSTPDRFTPDAGFLSAISTYVLPLVIIVLLQVLGLFRFIVEPVVALFQ